VSEPSASGGNHDGRGGVKPRRAWLVGVATGAVVLSAGVLFPHDGDLGLPDCGTPVPTGDEACMLPCEGLLSAGRVRYRCRYDPSNETPTTTVPLPTPPPTTAVQSLPPP
jgi:hypothetical protein